MGSIQDPQPQTNRSPAHLDFDPVAIKAKYRAERDKRLHELGTYQYREIEEASLSHYVEDPYSTYDPRPPVDKEIETLLIGSGFGGQLIAVRMIEAGLEDFTIVDKAGDFGGTWYWNRYPGAACDIESYIYMPLCEEMGYIPTEKYTRAPELFEYAKMIGRRYGLYEKAMFQTEVNQMDWDEAVQRWTVTTKRGDKLRARFVITASGPLHKPKLPGVPGIETYRGHSFHTSRWDYDYTGGNTTGGLDKISDKRIGIIGTGATAIQAVPHLGKGAGHLYVFQRTPSSVDFRGDRPTNPEWAKTLTPGWQQARMDNFSTIINGGDVKEDLVNDGWTTAIGAAKAAGKDLPPAERGKAAQLADFRKMSSIRARIDAIVQDSTTAEALKPWYNQFCKRPCFHDEYLDTFNRPNVSLVDTQGKGVERINENGVVVAGQQYDLDCIVYATGFEVGTDYSRRMRTGINGRGGLPLSDHWKDGTRTMHGMHTRNFPNLYIVGHAQASNTPNFTHMLNEQAKHIASILTQAKARGAKTLEVSAEAEEAWIQTILSFAKPKGFKNECTPGYYNHEGKRSRQTDLNATYGGRSQAFIRLLKEWREAGTLPGMELDGKLVEKVKEVDVEAFKTDLVKTNIDETVKGATAQEIVGNA